MKERLSRGFPGVHAAGEVGDVSVTKPSQRGRRDLAHSTTATVEHDFSILVGWQFAEVGANMIERNEGIGLGDLSFKECGRSQRRSPCA